MHTNYTMHVILTNMKLIFHMSYVLGPVLDHYKKTLTTSTSNTTNNNKHRRRRDSDSSMIHSSYNNSSDSNEEEEDEEMSNAPSVGFEQPSTVDTTTADSTDATTRCVYEYIYTTCMLRVYCTCILYLLCVYRHLNVCLY